MTTRSPEDDLVVALCAALAPYPWRELTPDMFARTALAASDRLGLAQLLGTVPGADLGPWHPLEPVARHDVRAARLVEFLSCHRWSELRLPALCRSLAGVMNQ